MIFVDSNVPMYLVGAAHPNKAQAQRVLEKLVAAGETLVTDAEVFQEILHRYTAIGRPEAIGAAFAALLSIAPDVYSIEVRDVLTAKRILLDLDGLSARDCLHVAIMRRHEVNRILTFDKGFDRCADVTRVKS